MRIIIDCYLVERGGHVTPAEGGRGRRSGITNI
jgi:hypothetical protein